MCFDSLPSVEIIFSEAGPSRFFEVLFVFLISIFRKGEQPDRLARICHRSSILQLS